MTEADLANIEAALGVTLPAYYREYMLNYPADLLAASYGPDGEPGEPADNWLHYKPETVIRENLSARRHLKLRGWTKPEPWPPKFLVIANDGGGDHWYIDVAAKPDMERLVWKFDHESGDRRVAATLPQWVEHLRSDEPPISVEEFARRIELVSVDVPGEGRQLRSAYLAG